MNSEACRTALVTGASGGIGRATAAALAQGGWRVYGTSRRPMSHPPRGVKMLVCDVTCDLAVEATVARVLAEAGRIDLLVNNAGHGIAAGAEESSAGQARALFEVNLFGVMRLTRAVLPAMRAAGRGRIVNLSSVVGLMPAPWLAIYAASKHALEGYSRSLDHELRGQGIRVLLVEPANTRTGFDLNLVPPDRPLDAYAADRDWIEMTLARLVAGGDGPEQVVEAILAAANDRHPRARYPAGPRARAIVWAARHLPVPLLDAILRWQMRRSHGRRD